MNKQSKLISVLLLIGLLSTGCSNNNPSSTSQGGSSTSTDPTTSSGVPSTSSAVISSSVNPGTSHKNITIHTSPSETKSVECYFFNNNVDIPFVEILDTVNKLMNTNEYEIALNNNIYTITNRFNDCTMSISTQGVVTLPDYAKFHTTAEYSDNCYIDEFRSTTLTCQKLAAQSSYTAPTSYSVDLSTFGFKPVNNNGKYYLPINVLHALIAPDTGTYYYGSDGEIYLYGHNKDMTSIVTPKAKTTYTKLKEFYEYNFNLFSLNTEVYFGLKGFSRTLRVNKSVLNYFPNGVINTFATYKDKIINSKDIAEFDKNMTDMISATMTDGGHTYCRYKSIANNPSEYLDDSAEDTYLHNLGDIGKSQRKLRPSDDGFGYEIYSFDTDEDGKYDIGYVTFDGFELEDKTKEGIFSVQSIFGGENGANTTLNKNADGYDSTNYDIKDVVIDLSLNGGGSVAAEGYVLSWICGGIAQQTLKGTDGKGYSKVTYNYDVNGDKKFDSKDYLSNDVNVYVIISPCTYSAANALAFDAYLYNTNLTRKINFIGQQSGGGACSVTELCYLPTGFSYRLAGNDASIYPNEQTKCCEDGVMPTLGLGITEFNDIFKRTGEGGINSLILSKRAK